MATFSTKSLHFPGEVPKNQQNQTFWTLPASPFLVFLVPPQEMATFSTKSLHFPGGVPKKPKKPKIFPPKACIFLGVLKKPKKPKILDSSGLAFAKTLFWYLLRKWQRFPPKACIFLERYQKNQQNQRFWTLQASPSPRLLKSLDFCFFCFFWYLLRKWQRFPPKACIFLEGYQKTKEPKILDSSGLAFAKTLKSLDFWIFWFCWYLLRKWQHFLSWLFCLLTTVSYSCISNR